jgi:hypothetical protein
MHDVTRRWCLLQVRADLLWQPDLGAVQALPHVLLAQPGQCHRPRAHGHPSLASWPASCSSTSAQACATLRPLRLGSISFT